MKIKNKPYLDKTTIQITSSVQDMYDRMVSRYGVTIAVSCGIALLNSLKPEDREKWVDELNRLADEDKRIYEESGHVGKTKLLVPILSGHIEKVQINPRGVSMDAAKVALGPSADDDSAKVIRSAANESEGTGKKKRGNVLKHA